MRQQPPAGSSRLQHRLRVHKQLFAAYDEQLDAGSDIHWLDDPRVAALMPIKPKTRRNS